MPGVGPELLFILLLVSLNGALAMSELAVVSARKVRLQWRADRGDARAGAVLALRNDPGSFLSTIQIGITLVGILAGAFGGATLTYELEAVFAENRFLAPYREPLSLALVVIAITYLSLIFGELLPKRIALNHAEQVALLVARPMNVLSRLLGPLVWVINQSTRAMLRLLRQPATREEPVTGEEIRSLIQQATEAGVFKAVQQDLMERSLDLGRLAAHHLMVPRTEMITLPHSAPLAHLAEIVERYPHSHYPVYLGGIDDIAGVVATKRLIPAVARAATPESGSFDVGASAAAPLFVPEATAAHELLVRMLAERQALAIVVDEFGATAGLVTLRDLLARFGAQGPPAAGGEGTRLQWLADGAALVDGLALLSDVAEPLGMDFGELEYNTVGGFVFGELGRRPNLGDAVAFGGRTFTVEELDGLRVARVRVMLG